MKSLLIVAGALVIGMLASCSSSPQSARGFRLPEGDAEKGKQAFVALDCVRCHKVDGVALPSPSQYKVLLGGERDRVKTHGDLVTSIINPSCVVPEAYRSLAGGEKSPMPLFNQGMTVEQMVDLVAFLQPRYTVAATTYPPAYP
jgi:mono/diheme cytochrome c family protein